MAHITWYVSYHIISYDIYVLYSQYTDIIPYHIISLGADVNIGSLINDASWSGRVPVILELFSHGVPVHTDQIKDENGNVVQHSVWASVRDIDVAQCLIDNNVNVPADVLLYCIDDADIVRFLIAHGADVNARDSHGYTPLHETCISSVVDALVSAGADVRAHNDSGETPLHYAADRFRWGLVEGLIAHGAEMDALDNAGHTALQIAGLYDRIPVARMLLDGGADGGSDFCMRYMLEHAGEEMSESKYASERMKEEKKREEEMEKREEEIQKREKGLKEREEEMNKREEGLKRREEEEKRREQEQTKREERK